MPFVRYVELGVTPASWLTEEHFLASLKSSKRRKRPRTLPRSPRQSALTAIQLGKSLST